MSGKLGLPPDTVDFSYEQRTTTVDNEQTRRSQTRLRRKGPRVNKWSFSRSHHESDGESCRCECVLSAGWRGGGYKPQMQESPRQDRRTGERHNCQKNNCQSGPSGVRQGSVRGTPDIDSGGSARREGRKQEAKQARQGCQGYLNISHALAPTPARSPARLARNRKTPDTPDTLKVPSGIYKAASGVPVLLIKPRQGSVRGSGVVR